MKGQLFAYWPTVKQSLGRSFSELLEAGEEVGEEASEEEEKEEEEEEEEEEELRGRWS